MQAKHAYHDCTSDFFGFSEAPQLTEVLKSAASPDVQAQNDTHHPAVQHGKVVNAIVTLGL